MLTKYFPFLFSGKQKRIVPVSAEFVDGDDNKNALAGRKPPNKPKELEDNVHFGTFRNKQRTLQESYAARSRGNEPDGLPPRGAVPVDKKIAMQGISENIVSNQAILSDCLEFVHGLNLQPQRMRHELLASDMCGAVFYEHDGFEILVNNPLGSFLLRSVLKKNVFQTQGNVNIEEFNMLMIAADSASTLIDYQRNMEDGLNMNQSLWIPLHGCLALTVSNLLSNI